MQEKTILNRDEILSKCIVLNGPMGSGKTVISFALADKLGMKAINLDTFRFLARRAEAYDPLIEQEEDAFEIQRLKLHKSFRQQFPNIKNFIDFGYNGEVCKKFRNRFGILGLHLYTKQFDNMLLEEILNKLDEPCIIDMGGTMGIALEGKYRSLLSAAALEDPALIQNFIKTEYMGFDKIQNFLTNFSNVVELRLPEDYKTTNRKASRSELNETFIDSGQYSAGATMTITTDRLVYFEGTKQKLNQSRLDEIIEEIFQNLNFKCINSCSDSKNTEENQNF